MAQLPATRRGQGGRMAARSEHPLERLHQDFDTLFDRLWGGWLAPLDRDVGTVRLWDFDVQENDQEVVIRAELPGFEENEIDVQLNQDTLIIRAEKEQKGDGQEEYRNFFRAITLPPGINPEQARATYRNGVLELHIPRAAEAQPRRIQIEGERAGNGQQGQQAGQRQQANQGQQAGKQAGAAATEARKPQQQPSQQAGATASEKAGK
jgi:HSP20 family protein